MIDFKEGAVVLIDKDLDWTSFDVVNKVRNIVKAKVGHAGTLDPKATGLLILCTGRFTKKIDSYQGMEKEYTGTFKIGVETPSFDTETEEHKAVDYSHITLTDVENAAKELTGIISQTPPQHSAIKVKGKRAYEHARKGETIALKTREVEVKEFEIVDFTPPFVQFRITCSKGTYVRSLARDLGRLVGVGAYLTELRRTRIGDFKVEEAKTIADFQAEMKQNSPE